MFISKKEYGNLKREIADKNEEIRMINKKNNDKEE